MEDGDHDRDGANHAPRQPRKVVGRGTPTPAQRRLLNDYKKITVDAPCGVSAAPVGDDLSRWIAIIYGAMGSIWQDGVWKLELTFPPEYPARPPGARFRNSMFHPNVARDGKVSFGLLREAAWDPTLDVCAVLSAIRDLLKEPEMSAASHGSANPDAEALYLRDRHQYDEKIMALVSAQGTEDDGMNALSAVP